MDVWSRGFRSIIYGDAEYHPKVTSVEVNLPVNDGEVIIHQDPYTTIFQFPDCESCAECCPSSPGEMPEQSKCHDTHLCDLEELVPLSVKKVEERQVADRDTVPLSERDISIDSPVDLSLSNARSALCSAQPCTECHETVVLRDPDVRDIPESRPVRLHPNRNSICVLTPPVAKGLFRACNGILDIDEIRQCTRSRGLKDPFKQGLPDRGFLGVTSSLRVAQRLSFRGATCIGYFPPKSYIRYFGATSLWLHRARRRVDLSITSKNHPLADFSLCSRLDCLIRCRPRRSCQDANSVHPT